MGSGPDRNAIAVEDLGHVMGMGPFDGEGQDRALARRLTDHPQPVCAVQALAHPGVERVFMIRDGLALNILGFSWTPQFIAQWQAAGPVGPP